MLQVYKTTTKQLILSGIASLINYFTVVIIGVTITRYGSAALYGDFAVIISVTTLVSFSIEMGASQLVRQLLPVYLKQQDHKRIQGLLVHSFIFTSALTLFTLFLIAALKFIFHIQFYQFTLWELFLAVLIALLLAEIRVFSAVINCRGYFVISSILYKMLYPLFLLSAIILLFLYKEWFGQVRLNDLVYSYFFAVSITLAITLIVLIYVNNFSKSYHAYFEIGKWIKIGLSYAANSIALFSSGSIGVIALELYDVPEHIVGVYAALLAISNILVLFITLSNRYYTPLLAVPLHKKNPTELRQFLKSRLYFLTIICVSYLLVIFIFGKQILLLYGPVFANYYPALIVLGILVVLETYMGISIYLVIMCDAKTQALVTQLSMLAATILIAIIAVPWIGLNGALISFVLPKLSVSIYNTWWLWKKRHINIFAM